MGVCTLGGGDASVSIPGRRMAIATDNEWRQMAKAYGGVIEASENKGKTPYKALVAGGRAGFHGLLGFYWTVSDINSANGRYYNFGQGGLALHRQDGGEKPR